jgi:hypothetical protein
VKATTYWTHHPSDRENLENGRMDELEIGQILHLKSEIPKSQIGLHNPTRVAGKSPI